MKTSLLTITMTGITSNQINNFDLLIIYTMLICCLMPMISIARSNEILSQIASSSFGCKIAMLIISYAVFIGDWSIGSIGTTILIVGDAGLIALTLLYGANKY